MNSRAIRWVGLLGAALTSLNLNAQQTTSKVFVPSDELNRNLPHWLRFSGEYRARVEGFTGGGFKKDNSDAYFLSRLRINMKVQPSDWLKLVVQGQDARVLGKNQSPPAPPFQNIMDLRLGYVELGDAEKKALGVRVGRQDLVFGDERLVGSAPWLNTPRSFDGIRATLRGQGYRFDAFASSVVNPRDGRFDRSVAGNNFYGLYTVFDGLFPKATVEPYFLWRRAPNLPTKTGTRAQLKFATVGFRWVGKLPGGFDYGAEIAGQTGSLGTESIGAWAGHWLLGYRMARARFKPRISAEYNYASGDNDPHSSKRGTFDQLYPSNHDKYGLADQVGWKNIHHVRGGIEFKPQTQWLVASRYNSFWLASTHDALYNASGALVAKVTDGSAGRHVGQELDFLVVYSPSKQIQIGSGYAYLFPGTFLKKATAGTAYSYPYFSVNYIF